jgi:hypothetical protein
MIHESPQSLSSLVRPLIVNPGQRVEKDKDSLPLRRPPYPGVDLRNWDGFTISHLHWVGIKLTNASLSEKLRRIKLAILHEVCHIVLAHTPYLLINKV